MHGRPQSALGPRAIPNIYGSQVPIVLLKLTESKEEANKGFQTIGAKARLSLNPDVRIKDYEHRTEI